MQVYYLSEPRLTGVGKVRAQVLRLGRWHHPNAPNKELVVDRALLKRLKDAFEQGIVGYELPVKVEHDGELVGWVTQLEEDGNALYAHIEMVDPKAYQEVMDKKLRYASAELLLQYLDPETRSQYDVLRGVALTNYPYIKRMEPVVTLSEWDCPPCTEEVDRMTKQYEEMETEVVDTITEEEFEALVAQAKEAAQLRRRLQELEGATTTTSLSELETQRVIDDLLREHSIRLTPALTELFSYAFRIAQGQKVYLSDIAHRFPQTPYRLNLSESELNRPADMVQVLTLLLSELPTVPRTDRPNYADPTISIRGDVASVPTTQLIHERAERLSREQGIPYGEAVKRVVREVM